MAGGERPWRKSAEIPFHDAQHRLHFKKKAMKSPAANKQKRTRVAESVQTTKWMQTRDRSKATKSKPNTESRCDQKMSAAGSKHNGKGTERAPH